MRKSVILMTAAALTLTSCGTIRDSRVNPFNWFGSSKSAPVSATEDEKETVNPLLPDKGRRGIFARPDAEDLSVPATAISELRVERTPSGAIIFATAVTERQGAFDANLRLEPADPEDPSVMTFSFMVDYPERQTRVGPANTRTVRAARSVSSQDLAPVRTIRVLGATNLRETRRR